MAVNFFQLYQEVLQNELCYIDGDEEEEMEMAMDILLASYSVAGLKIADSLNFNKIELRCAYLFLFATSHSHMVLDALSKLYEQNYTELLNLIHSASRTLRSFNITSLGGGPGSDPVGILTFLHQKELLASCPLVKVNVVDEYCGWENIFLQVMDRFGNYPLRAQFKDQDLLFPLTWEVQELLRNTHFLSMVKFISAISGDKYAAIISLKEIFSHLKPGTLILIIDNAGGPDFKQAFDLAKTMGLKPIIEPVLHYGFRVPKMDEPGIGRMKYGKRPQTTSTISIVILKKCGSAFNANQESEYCTPKNSISILNRLQLANTVNCSSNMQPKANPRSMPSHYANQGTFLKNTHQQPFALTYNRETISRPLQPYVAAGNSRLPQQKVSTSTPSKPSVSAYSLAATTYPNRPVDLNYQYRISQPKTNTVLTSSYGLDSSSFRTSYTERPYSQFSQPSRIKSPQYSLQPKKKESKCCLF